MILLRKHTICYSSLLFVLNIMDNFMAKQAIELKTRQEAINTLMKEQVRFAKQTVWELRFLCLFLLILFLVLLKPSMSAILLWLFDNRLPIFGEFLC